MKTVSLVVLLFLVIIFGLAGTGFSVPLSEMDLGWFQERPLDLEWGRDPFVPKVRVKEGEGAPDAAKVAYVLTAVLLGEGKPAAVLNGAVVQEGDAVQGHRVTRITKKSIFLRGPSGTMEIPLKPLFSFEGQRP